MITNLLKNYKRSTTKKPSKRTFDLYRATMSKRRKRKKELQAKRIFLLRKFEIKMILSFTFKKLLFSNKN